MTFFGKALVFLNLVLGIGAAVFGTTIYTKRPGWNAELVDGGIDKGNAPMSFKQLAADIDQQGKAAAVANANWSANYKTLTVAESDRGTRYERMFGTTLAGGKAAAKGLLDNAKEVNGPAFLNLTEDSNTRLLNLNPDQKTAGVIVNGPDGQPLRGTETLLAQFELDTKEVDVQSLASKMHRATQKTLGDEIVKVQNRIYIQRDIRDNLLVEASRLEAFEVNATEHMQTVTRRRNQLMGRLSPFEKK